MITITGSLKQVGGSADSAASITFELKGFGTWLPAVAGTGLIAETKLTATITNGAFSVQLYGNDVIIPTGTFYMVTVTTDEGAVLGSVPYQFTGAGPIDLSTLTPLLTVPTDISPLKALDCNAFTIQIRRGLVAALPALANGELYFCTDTNQLYAGDAGINVLIEAQADNLPTFVDPTVPTGTIDGVNRVFTVPNAPNPATSLLLFRNGLLQTRGVDYTLSGTTITFASNCIPQIGDVLVYSCRY
jgi:Major tropism determinant N-terminal domain